MRELLCSATGHQILFDGVTVWVNHRSTGESIARFCRFGVDIHRLGNDEASHCLDCFPIKDRPEAWERFAASMKTHYGVVMPDEARPKDCEGGSRWVRVRS